MFQYKDGRIYPDVTPRTLSFKIPEGFWIDTSPDGISDDSISLYSPDKNAGIEVMVGRSIGGTTEADVSRCFEDSMPENIDGPYPVSVNGMAGHYIFFLGRRKSQYVLTLDVGDCGFVGNTSINDEKYKRIEITITIENCSGKEESLKSIKEAVNDSDVVALIESIRTK